MTTVSLSGGDKLERRLAALATRVAKGATLKVGFLEGATYPDGTNVAQIAAIQNFGAPAKGIPPRPFFSDFIKRYGPEWGAQLARLLVASDYDALRALNLMGFKMSAQLRQQIVDTNAPPNSPVTDLLKQRFPTGDYEPGDVWQAFHDVAAGATAPAGKPLVWSGTMLNAVDHEVVEGV